MLRWMWRLTCAVVLGLITIDGLLPVAIQAAQDDEDEQREQYPGIWGTYSAAGRNVARRDPDIAFVWGAESPLQQLARGPFTVDWQGKLLVRAPGKYRFHAHLQGRLDVTFNGQKVLAGESPADGAATWISGPETDVEYGQLPLVVHFQSAGPQARVKLYWSSDSFALEPVPSAAYFLNEPHPVAEIENRGRELFAAHRCNRCHQRENDPPSLAGPDLTHVAAGLQGDWIERWLAGDRPTAAHSRMPEFGFTKKESAAIAAFLRHQSTDVKIPARDVDDAKLAASAEAGRAHFMTLGCLACHTHDKVGTDGHFGGGDLTSIGAKRSADWLALWLVEPKQLNADHHMPVFDWNGKTAERRELIAFLARSRGGIEQSNETNLPPKGTAEIIEQGRQLVVAARCDACHRMNKVAAPSRPALPTLENYSLALDPTCLQTQPDRKKWRPAYPRIDVEALRVYLLARAGKLAPEGAVERGQRLLAWNNCLQCHPRDGGAGLGQHTATITRLVPNLEGQSPTLVPPRLNAVGDKLLDNYLAKAVAGEFKSRLPWLRVKMPRFDHSESDRKALTQYFVDHDRIETPPQQLVEQAPVPTGQAHVEALSAGTALVGSQGFSCVACHQFGKFVPRNTALGTRGSDLLQISQRMRREYFLRWTRSPIRIIPDMEMPGYERPLPNLLGGRIDSQLAALWESVNDANSARSLDVSSLQQSLAVSSGEPARIIRDVFFLPKAPPRLPDRYVPRTFAVGFNTQHNVLFDLDRFVIRDWWRGDLARQRTEGKSWNWEIGGAPIAGDTFSTLLRVDVAFLSGAGESARLVEFDSSHATNGRLLEYDRVGNGVRLRYQLPFGESPGEKQHVEISEEWQPVTSAAPGAAQGWSREITASSLPDKSKYVPIFTRRTLDRSLGASIDLPPASSLKWQTATGRVADAAGGKFDYAELVRNEKGEATGLFHYSAQPAPAPASIAGPPSLNATAEAFSTVPGYRADRLPLPTSIMPTALTWTKAGELAFASLKGHVYIARDTDQNGMEDTLHLFEEGLAAPYGLISDPLDGSLIVSHKPELLRLIDSDGDGRADVRKIFATGWGYNDNYHDWTCGIVRDSKGNLYVGLGSDYTQPKRPVEQQLWRGKILRIDPTGKPTPIAAGLRYPTGLAMNADDELFVSDNQGEQNVFNELNHIVEGAKYGVPSREDPKDERPAATPAIQIPHPWTRSINGIFFIPRTANLSSSQSAPHPFAGHGIGCEYDSRFLIRFTVHKVADTFQGAVYPFSQDHVPPETPNFEGTLCGAVSPRGDIYIGCIHDSGWLGGLNVGSIVKLQSTGKIPLGIREIQATPQGFQIDFTESVHRESATDIANYSISAYTRQWQGTYATPDSNRHQVVVNRAKLLADGRQVQLMTDTLRPGYVYEISCGKIGLDRSQALWPATGHYTVNRVPVEK